MRLAKPNLANLSSAIFSSIFSSSNLPDRDLIKFELGNLSEIKKNSSAIAHVLLLVDGMGSEIVQMIGERFPILNTAVANYELTSLFPSTTVTNLTSLEIGRAHV